MESAYFLSCSLLDILTLVQAGKNLKINAINTKPGISTETYIRLIRAQSLSVPEEALLLYVLSKLEY